MARSTKYGRWLKTLQERCRKAGYYTLVVELHNGGFYTDGTRAHGHIEALYPVCQPEGPQLQRYPGDRGWKEVALWRILSDMKISSGCGSGHPGVHQHHVTLYGPDAEFLGEYVPQRTPVTFQLRNTRMTLGTPIFVGKRRQ